MWEAEKVMAMVWENLAKIETDIKRLRMLVSKFNKWESIPDDWGEFIREMSEKLLSYKEDNAVEVVEWVYDWLFMMWSDNKKYPIPMNYSSKSKLVSWDVLKLRIMNDGKLIYKLIGPAERLFIKASLSKNEEGKRVAMADNGNTYILNAAAVSFFKWEIWSDLSIIVNKDWKWQQAAIEAKL